LVIALNVHPENVRSSHGLLAQLINAFHQHHLT
jgi:hypothetical protein